MITNNLEKLRVLNGLSKNKLAKLSGVSQVQIGRYERGQQMTENNIKLLAQALGVTTDLLLGFRLSVEEDLKKRE